MENHILYPIIVLKVNINCCKDCSKKLKKALSNINGVYSVATDPEKKLVYVAGNIDPKFLLNSITKMGKRAEILSYIKEPKKDRRQAYDDHFFNRRPNYYEKEDYNFRRNGNEEKKCDCHENYGRKKERDDDHQFENYIPPPVDPEVCRDPFCKLHKRRPIFAEKVPSWDSADHPHHTARFFHGGNPMFHHRNHFDDYYYQPKMSQPGYNGFYGDPGYGIYGDDSNCTIM